MQTTVDGVIVIKVLRPEFRVNKQDRIGINALVKRTASVYHREEYIRGENNENNKISAV